MRERHKIDRNDGLHIQNPIRLLEQGLVFQPRKTLFAHHLERLICMKPRTILLVVIFVGIVGFVWLLATPPPPTDEGEYFTVRVVDETFIILMMDPEAIQDAKARFEGKNSMFPIGTLVRGDGGFNSPWSWHLDPDTVSMTEVAIELCSGRPSDVEADVDYWIDTVRSFCPWSAEIIKVGR